MGRGYWLVDNPLEKNLKEIVIGDTFEAFVYAFCNNAILCLSTNPSSPEEEIYDYGNKWKEVFGLSMDDLEIKESILWILMIRGNIKPYDNISIKNETTVKVAYKGNIDFVVAESIKCFPSKNPPENSNIIDKFWVIDSGFINADSDSTMRGFLSPRLLVNESNFIKLVYSRARHYEVFSLLSQDELKSEECSIINVKFFMEDYLKEELNHQTFELKRVIRDTNTYRKYKLDSDLNIEYLFDKDIEFKSNSNDNFRYLHLLS